MKKTQPLTIIAGPCSIDERNIEEVYQIANIKIQGKPAIWGTRIVGLKSRTSLATNGNGMGMDYQTIVKNQQILSDGGTVHDLETPPSVTMAVEVIAKTNMLIATEIMLPLVQIPTLAHSVPNHKVLLWNASVNQLGWPVWQMAQSACLHNWSVGIKNGKWIGDHVYQADSTKYQGQTPLEKTWAGLAAYAQSQTQNIILIHRGVDVPEKKNYRNLPVHEIAKRTKQASGCQLYFDPSHSYGPKMRGDIVEATIKAMQIKMPDDNYVYDGILIEAGTSQTDTEQHITIAELQYMVEQLATFRKIHTRVSQTQHLHSHIFCVQ